MGEPWVPPCRSPNLQRVRVLLNGVARRAYVCTKCLKAGKVQKAV
jgi:large subunit ribosomal protein L28